MPQSLGRILLHLVFSTKDREPWPLDTVRDELHAYLGGLVRERKGALLAAGSTQDHIHLLIAAPRTMAPADLVREVKALSTAWLKRKDGRLANFAWQKGYGVFSVSPSHRDEVERYVKHQAEHHRKQSFQDEYRALLRKCGVEWDERYVWD